jgi:hypothetical protein
MAMKKDDDKTKKSASSKKKDSLGSPTMSGKKPYKIGGDNPLGVRKLNASKPTASTQSGPRAVPSRPMGRDATGSANFDRTSSSRASVSVGPATINMGGRTAKSKGGMNMTGGKVLPKKSVNPAAKMSPGTKKPGSPTVPITKIEYSGYKKTNSIPIAIGAGVATVGGGLMLAGGGKKIKQAAKYIGDTKERKERKRVQKAENDAMIVERKAKADAKNPTIVGKNSKISKSTMKKLKAR